MSDTNSELAKDFEKLIKKASDSNSQVMSQATKVVNHLLTHKVEISDLSKLNSSIMTSALEDLVQMSLKHTSNLLDWGVAVSKHVSSQIIRDTNTTDTTATTEPRLEVFQLFMTGTAGDAASTSFLLHSDKEGVSQGQFNLSPFISEDGNDVLKTSMTVNPMSFNISKEQPLRIDMSVVIPADAAAGVYNSKVQVQGFDNTEFQVVLTVAEVADIEVNENQETATPPAKKAAKSRKK